MKYNIDSGNKLANSDIRHDLFRAWHMSRRQALCKLSIGAASLMTGPLNTAEQVAHIPGPVTSVRSVHGRPQFFLDDRPYTKPFFETYVPETMDYLCRASKEACGGRKVVGAFYCYMFEFGGDPEYGHNAMARFLRSKYIDFAMVTASYGGYFDDSRLLKEVKVLIALLERAQQHNCSSVAEIRERVLHGSRTVVWAYARVKEDCDFQRPLTFSILLLTNRLPGAPGNLAGRCRTRRPCSCVSRRDHPIRMVVVEGR
ncbi:MAG: hypothetical protein JW829_16135 [Pirellulales bacterium]|nr:hypothetical protein [Pirellulales bacterium]